MALSASLTGTFQLMSISVTSVPIDLTLSPVILDISRTLCVTSSMLYPRSFNRGKTVEMAVAISLKELGTLTARLLNRPSNLLSSAPVAPVWARIWLFADCTSIALLRLATPIAAMGTVMPAVIAAPTAVMPAPRVCSAPISVFN